MNMKFLWVIGIFLLVSTANCHAQFVANAKRPVQTQKLYLQQYGNWLYRCQKRVTNGVAQKPTCQVAQELTIQNGKYFSIEAEIIFTKQPGKDTYDLSAMVPAGLFTPAGVAFSTDQNKPVVEAINSCRPYGCLLLPRPASALVAAFRTGLVGHITWMDLQGNSRTLLFSLIGFSDAMNALNSDKLPPPLNTADIK